MTENKLRSKKPAEPGRYWWAVGRRKGIAIIFKLMGYEKIGLCGTLQSDDGGYYESLVYVSEANHVVWGPKIEEWKTEIDGSDDPPKEVKHD